VAMRRRSPAMAAACVANGSDDGRLRLTLVREMRKRPLCAACTSTRLFPHGSSNRHTMPPALQIQALPQSHTLALSILDAASGFSTSGQCGILDVDMRLRRRGVCCASEHCRALADLSAPPASVRGRSAAVICLVGFDAPIVLGHFLPIFSCRSDCLPGYRGADRSKPYAT